MTEYKGNLLNKFGMNSKPHGNDVMSDPEYLRQSSSLINESLQKGFDVLQLPNGDVITTITKTITTQYVWEEKDKKLVKTTKSSENNKKSGKIEKIEDSEEINNSEKEQV